MVPYILKSFTSKSSIEMTKNENYWDKDKVYISDVKWNSTMDKTKVNWPNHSVKMLWAWQNSSQLDLVTQEQAKEFKDEITYTPQDAASYVIGTNIDRQSYKHTR